METVSPPQPSAALSPAPLHGGVHDTRSSDLWPAGRVLVVAATYNEVDNIAPLTAAVLAASPAAQMLVVDDASPDGTGEVALRRAGQRHSGGVFRCRGPRIRGGGEHGC